MVQIHWCIAAINSAPALEALPEGAIGITGDELQKQDVSALCYS